MRQQTGCPPFWLWSPIWPYSTFFLWCTCPRAFIRSTSTSGNVVSTRWTWKLPQRSIFRHTVWPWRGLKVWLHAMKTRGSVSRTYKVQSTPNYTCKTRVPALWQLQRNYDKKSQRPLVETGSDMFYTLMNCSWLLYNMQLKRPQSSHLIMVTIVTFPQTV